MTWRSIGMVAATILMIVAAVLGFIALMLFLSGLGVLFSGEVAFAEGFIAVATLVALLLMAAIPAFAVVIFYEANDQPPQPKAARRKLFKLGWVTGIVSGLWWIMTAGVLWDNLQQGGGILHTVFQFWLSAVPPALGTICAVAALKLARK